MENIESQYLFRSVWSAILSNYQEKSNGCIEWTGHTLKANKRNPNALPYGRFTVCGRRILAHRASWLVSRGGIPKGMKVLHSCDNARCINPKHLYLGSQAENARDMATRNRCGNTKLTENQAIEILTNFSKTLSEFAEEFDVSLSTACDVRNRRTWKHLAIPHG